MTEQEFVNFAFVSETSHREEVCTCPECGEQFFMWIDRDYVTELNMIKSTTLCTYCQEEDEESEEEEESFPSEER